MYTPQVWDDGIEMAGDRSKREASSLLSLREVSLPSRYFFRSCCKAFTIDNWTFAPRLVTPLNARPRVHSSKHPQAL